MKPRNIVIFILLFLAILVLITKCKEVSYTVKGKVVSHNVTADKLGNRTYSTIIICEDGYIREETGLQYYVIPIGNTAYVKIYDYKFEL